MRGAAIEPDSVSSHGIEGVLDALLWDVVDVSGASLAATPAGYLSPHQRALGAEVGEDADDSPLGHAQTLSVAGLSDLDCPPAASVAGRHHEVL
ncbi:MAG: hypothetical protein AAF311_11285 [Pseudomonadota bacterium]